MFPSAPVPAGASSGQRRRDDADRGRATALFRAHRGDPPGPYWPPRRAPTVLCLHFQWGCGLRRAAAGGRRGRGRRQPCVSGCDGGGGGDPRPLGGVWVFRHSGRLLSLPVGYPRRPPLVIIIVIIVIIIIVIIVIVIIVIVIIVIIVIVIGGGRGGHLRCFRHRRGPGQRRRRRRNGGRDRDPARVPGTRSRASPGHARERGRRRGDGRAGATKRRAGRSGQGRFGTVLRLIVLVIVVVQ